MTSTLKSYRLKSNDPGLEENGPPRNFQIAATVIGPMLQRLLFGPRLRSKKTMPTTLLASATKIPPNIANATKIMVLLPITY